MIIYDHFSLLNISFDKAWGPVVLMPGAFPEDWKSLKATTPFLHLPILETPDAGMKLGMKTKRWTTCLEPASRHILLLGLSGIQGGQGHVSCCFQCVEACDSCIVSSRKHGCRRCRRFLMLAILGKLRIGHELAILNYIGPSPASQRHDTEADSMLLPTARSEIPEDGRSWCQRLCDLPTAHERGCRRANEACERRVAFKTQLFSRTVTE